MKKKRFAVEQIVAVLKEAEAGMPVAELIRRILALPSRHAWRTIAIYPYPARHDRPASQLFLNILFFLKLSSPSLCRLDRRQPR